MSRMTSRVLAGILLLPEMGGMTSDARGQALRCEKYQLDNGMTVILHEDHRLPIVAVNTWYRVGAQDEPPGRSGFAHLFEHLMFMGTRRVPGSAFDVIMESGGGANNATTDLHRTNYFSWGPARLLPTLLWLDADRLEDMGLHMTQEKLDRQRDVVRNELRQTVENRPYGQAEEMVYRLMFPPGHPYHWGVIGTHQDLEAATLGNVRDFFATFYVPRNAAIVVAGDFDPAKVRPLIADLFGTIPGGAEPPRRAAERARLTSEVRFTTIDKVQLPRLMLAYHSPAAYREGDAEMRLAAAALGEGRDSRLYRRLVHEEQLAVEVSAAQNGYPLGSLFQVDAWARPDADLDRVAQVLDEELAKFRAEGPTAEETERCKATMERALLASLQSPSAVADKLNEYEYYWGEPDSLERDLERYRRATAEDVRTQAELVLDPKSRAVIRVLPEQPLRNASPRDQRPADLPAGEFSPASPQVFHLPNSVPVMVWRRPELPLVSVRLAMRAEPGPELPQKSGATSLAMEMIQQGAGERDAAEFAAALRALGAELAAGAEHEWGYVDLTVLKRNLGPALALLADAVRKPRIAEDDWERVRTNRLAELAHQEESPRLVARRVGARLLYGDRHPYAWPTEGVIPVVTRLAGDDVRAAHALLFRPHQSALLIAGDVEVDEIRPLLDEHLGTWNAIATPLPDMTVYMETPRHVPQGGALRVALVHRPDAVQTVIHFAMPGVRFDDGRRAALRVLNVLLGGSFTSRLNQNLREDKGYTYGARTRFEMGRSTGTFTATAEVRADATGAALREFLYEFERIRRGDVGEEEADKARRTLEHEIVQSLATLEGVTALGSELAVNGMSLDTPATDLAAVRRVTAEELNALAGAFVAPERGVLVLVGDRGVILPQIAGMGLAEPLECDARGGLVSD